MKGENSKPSCLQDTFDFQAAPSSPLLISFSPFHCFPFISHSSCAVFEDASVVPDFGNEEIPIIAMTHVTAGSEKNGTKEKEEWKKLNIFAGPLTMHTR